MGFQIAELYADVGIKDQGLHKGLDGVRAECEQTHQAMGKMAGMMQGHGVQARHALMMFSQATGIGGRSVMEMYYAVAMLGVPLGAAVGGFFLLKSAIDKNAKAVQETKGVIAELTTVFTELARVTNEGLFSDDPTAKRLTEMADKIDKLREKLNALQNEAGAGGVMKSIKGAWEFLKETGSGIGIAELNLLGLKHTEQYVPQWRKDSQAADLRAAQEETQARGLAANRKQLADQLFALEPEEHKTALGRAGPGTPQELAELLNRVILQAQHRLEILSNNKLPGGQENTGTRKEIWEAETKVAELLKAQVSMVKEQNDLYSTLLSRLSAPRFGLVTSFDEQQRMSKFDKEQKARDDYIADMEKVMKLTDEAQRNLMGSNAQKKYNIGMHLADPHSQESQEMFGYQEREGHLTSGEQAVRYAKKLKEAVTAYALTPGETIGYLQSERKKLGIDKPGGMSSVEDLGRSIQEAILADDTPKQQLQAQQDALKELHEINASLLVLLPKIKPPVNE